MILTKFRLAFCIVTQNTLKYYPKFEEGFIILTDKTVVNWQFFWDEILLKGNEEAHR